MKKVKNITVIKEFWEGENSFSPSRTRYVHPACLQNTGSGVYSNTIIDEEDWLNRYGLQLLHDGYIEVEYEDGSSENYPKSEFISPSTQDIKLNFNQNSLQSDLSVSERVKKINNLLDEAIKQVEERALRGHYITQLPEKFDLDFLEALQSENWLGDRYKTERKLNQLIDCIAELRGEERGEV